MGIENLKIGDVFVSYNDEEPYKKFEEMAKDALLSYSALSIKMTTYNADPTQGSVNWKKNIDGSDSTLNVRQKPRNL
jgi:ABC-type molybdate transport system substrate-binding protein